MSKKSLGYSALIFLLACFSYPAWSQESTGLKKIRIGMPNRGVPNLGLPAAQRFGFFRAQGLDAELIVMRPSVSLQTLLAGEIRRRRRLPMFCRAKGNQRSEARKVTDAFCWISLGEMRDLTKMSWKSEFQRHHTKQTLGNGLSNRSILGRETTCSH